MVAQKIAKCGGAGFNIHVSMDGRQVVVLDIEKRSNDFRVHDSKDRRAWDCGRNIYEALWSWIAAHGSDYGLNIHTENLVLQ